MRMCIVLFFLQGFGKMLISEAEERQILHITPKKSICPHNAFTRVRVFVIIYLHKIRKCQIMG